MAKNGINEDDILSYRDNAGDWLYFSSVSLVWTTCKAGIFTFMSLILLSGVVVSVAALMQLDSSKQRAADLVLSWLSILVVMVISMMFLALVIIETLKRYNHLRFDVAEWIRASRAFRKEV